MGRRRQHCVFLCACMGLAIIDYNFAHQYRCLSLYLYNNHHDISRRVFSEIWPAFQLASTLGSNDNMSLHKLFTRIVFSGLEHFASNLRCFFFVVVKHFDSPLPHPQESESEEAGD